MAPLSQSEASIVSCSPMRGQDCPDRRGWTSACLLAVTDPLFTILYFSSKEFTNSLVIKYKPPAALAISLSWAAEVWAVTSQVWPRPLHLMTPGLAWAGHWHSLQGCPPRDLSCSECGPPVYSAPWSPLAGSAMISPQFITRVMNGPGLGGLVLTVVSPHIKLPPLIAPHTLLSLIWVSCVYKVMMMWPPMVTPVPGWPH